MHLVLEASAFNRIQISCTVYKVIRDSFFQWVAKYGYIIRLKNVIRIMLVCATNT